MRHSSVIPLYTDLHMKSFVCLKIEKLVFSSLVSRMVVLWLLRGIDTSPKDATLLWTFCLPCWRATCNRKNFLPLIVVPYFKKASSGPWKRMRTQSFWKYLSRIIRGDIYVYIFATLKNNPLFWKGTQWVLEGEWAQLIWEIPKGWLLKVWIYSRGMDSSL